MGLVESIFGKIHHLVINPAGSTLRNPPRNTAGNAFLRIAKDKIRPLLFHNRLFFLAHGPAHQIAPPHGIAAQIPHNLHDLFLIDDTAICGRQYWFQFRTGIGNIPFTVFPFDIFGDKIHGARTIQGNPRNDVFQVLRFQFLHESFHAPAFYLEDPFIPARADGLQHSPVVVIHTVHINDFTGTFADIFHSVLNDRQGTKPQEIHFQKPQLFQSRHGKLCGNRTVRSS